MLKRFATQCLSPSSRKMARSVSRRRLPKESQAEDTSRAKEHTLRSKTPVAKKQDWILGAATLQPIQGTTVELWRHGQMPTDVAPTALPADAALASDAFVQKHEMRVVRAPPDGSCLFHALSYPLRRDGIDGRRLRRKICAYMARHPDMEIANTRLEDWVKLDSGRDFASYVAKMSKTGTEGGGIEIEVFTRLTGHSVNVFQKCPGGYQRTCCFDSPCAVAGCDPERSDRIAINVLYSSTRRHYDALVPEMSF